MNLPAWRMASLLLIASTIAVTVPAAASVPDGADPATGTLEPDSFPSPDTLAPSPEERLARYRDADRLKGIRLTDYHLTWEVLNGLQYEHSRFPGTTAPDQVRWSTLLGERLGGFVAGSILHPRFWKFEAGLAVAVLQEWYRDLDQSSWRFKNRFEPEFVFDSQVLSGKPYPLHLYGRRRIELVRRDFSRNFDLTTTTAGGEWTWRNGVVPVRIAGQWQMNEFGRTAREVGDDSTALLTAEARHEGPTDSGVAEYRFYFYENALFPTLDYRAHDFALRHTWNPETAASSPRVRLDSNARYGLRYANRDRDDGAINEALSLRWRPELESRLTYGFGTSHASDDRTYRNTLNLDTRYRLYQSLFVGGFAQGTVYSLPDGRTLGTLGGGDVTYRKRLFDALVMSHSVQALGGREWGQISQWFPVFDEEIRLVGVEPARLQRLEVDTLSVEIMDPSTHRIYLKDIDYELIAEGDRILVARVPTGEIPDGATMLASYRYHTDASDVTTADVRYAGRIFTDFSPYFRVALEYREEWSWRWADHPGSSGRERLTSVGGSISGHYDLVSANFDAHWIRMDGFEVVDHSGMVSLRPSWRGFVPIVGARYLLQWQGRPAKEFRRYYEAFVEGSATIVPDLTTTFRWRFHREDGGPADGNYLDGQTFLDWRLRSMRLRLEYRLRSQVRTGHWYEDHRVFFSVGRPF